MCGDEPEVLEGATQRTLCLKQQADEEEEDEQRQQPEDGDVHANPPRAS